MKTILFLLGGLLVLVVLAFLFWRRRAAEQGERPLTALVFLLSEPRTPADWQVRSAAAKALGVELAMGDEPAPNTIMRVAAEKVDSSIPAGAGTTWFINTGGRQFLVNSFARPYMEDPEKFAGSIADLRLRRAVAGHRAWISADVFGAPPSTAEREAIYAQLGRLLAPLAGDDCLALYSPELERCNEMAPSVLDALAGGRSLEVFEEPTHAPVYGIADDDPRMVAAVEEARRRWPEFVAAFGRRTDPEAPFLLKARFAEGDEVEFMWVTVEQVGADTATGRLANSPAALQKIKEGDLVTVPLTDLNDWVYPAGDEPVGGFTIKVLAEAAGKK